MVINRHEHGEPPTAFQPIARAGFVAIPMQPTILSPIWPKLWHVYSSTSKPATVWALPFTQGDIFRRKRAGNHRATGMILYMPDGTIMASIGLPLGLFAASSCPIGR